MSGLTAQSPLERLRHANACIAMCRCGSVPTYALARFKVLHPGVEEPPVLSGVSVIRKASSLCPKDSSLAEKLGAYADKRGRYASLLEWEGNGIQDAHNVSETNLLASPRRA